jgi:FkbM family methyltransferase
MSDVIVRTHEGLAPFVKWYWPKSDDGAWDGPVDDWIVSHGPLISTFEKKRGVIQAGGCCGMYPALLSSMYDQVLTFEPDAINFSFLEMNCEGLPNVWYSNSALGDTHKFVGVNRLTMNNVGMHQVVDTPNGDVPMTTIDSEAFKLRVPVDLIWLDLEGYEYLALLGAIETIKEFHPIIGVERASGSIRDLLNPMGYRELAPSKMDTFFIHREDIK